MWGVADRLTFQDDRKGRPVACKKVTCSPGAYFFIGQQRLNGPILAHDPRNPLHQFYVVGLHALGLAFGLRMAHHIHWNLFFCFSVAHVKDLQNQTIIFDNYSITLCEGASII